MPTEPDLPMIQRPFKPWITGCALHVLKPLDAPTITIRVNGKPASAFHDSESTVILAWPTVLG